MLTTHAERVQTTQVEELLSNMNWARGELEALIASTPPELMIGPRKDGWSAKDHLYHLATWDLYLIAVLERSRACRQSASTPIQARHSMKSMPSFLSEARICPCGRC